MKLCIVIELKKKIQIKIGPTKDVETQRFCYRTIIISTWQSIYKLGSPWFQQFGCIVGDEVHGFKSKSLSSIMNKSIEAEYRFGTTGTLDGTTVHKLVLEGLFGPTYTSVTTVKLQEDKHLVKEVGDLVCMIELLQEWEVVSYSAVENSRQKKLDKLKIWSNLFSSEEERSLYYDDIVVSEN
jgi:superfamily II DNA or RNA helicase